MIRTIFKSLSLCTLLLLSIAGIAQQSANTVSYKVTYDVASQIYTAWVVPNYNVPNLTNTGATEKGATAQFTLVVPKDFLISNITDINGTWAKEPLKMGPGQQDWTGYALDPNYNYYVLGKSPAETDYGNFMNGQAVALFTFKGNSCLGLVSVLPPNSLFATAADAKYSLGVANSFYSRSGQPSGGNQNPLEQFISVVGGAATCSANSTTLTLLPDNITSLVGTSVLIKVLENDMRNGLTMIPSEVSLSISQNSSNGNVSVNSDGTLTYTPNIGFTGTDCYTYQVCDKITTSICSTSQVCITVLSLQKNIYAFDDNNITKEAVPVSGNLLSNDIVATGTAPLILNTSPIQQPSHGTVILNAAGTYTYTPMSGFTGTDIFKYQVCDSGTPAVCDIATVNINIEPSNKSSNNAPVALSDNAVTNKDTPVSGNVMTNDKDPDAGQTLTASVVSNPTHGTLVLNPNGSYTYTPNAGFTGSDIFTYKVCDNGTPILCDEAVVNLTVKAADGSTLPPIANDDLFFRDPASGVSGNVLANDSDPNGGTLIVTTTPVSSQSNGTVSINANGTFTYTPNAGYTGIDMFTYQVCNNQNPKQCSQATVYILAGNAATGNTDIRVSKTANKSAAQLNELISYTIVVKNLGPDPATNIIVKDSLSTGLVYQSASANKGTFVNPQWNIPLLASGDSAVLTLTAKVVAEGVSTNFAKVLGQDQTDPNAQNNEASACSSVPMNICRGDKLQLSVPSTYTNVKWYKDGVMVSSGNVYLATESGTYTMSASNGSCPSNGCCPFVVVVSECCPANVCIPVTITKIIR